ncbi:MAG: SDR family NAD(P)-dependent oxidoreductase [Desulfobacterales bacterium]|nr:SDR family NAD(P)-dependent oxidoreductase [Desulfobacterales bacterium]
MQKTILINGATDGIGLETSKALVGLGHKLLLHGRNPAKLEAVSKAFFSLTAGADTGYYAADFSDMAEVEALAKAVAEKYEALDVPINNAGVYRSAELVTQDGLDIRFAVDTIALYLLTKRLLPLIESSGRVINLSSAEKIGNRYVLRRKSIPALAGGQQPADTDNPGLYP